MPKKRKKSLKTLEKEHKALGKKIEKRRKQEAKKAEIADLKKQLKKLKGKKKWFNQSLCLSAKKPTTWLENSSLNLQNFMAGDQTPWNRQPCTI